ncbi:hemolysin family protein [Asticcacaulis sp. AND118]|uniref:hemolysin family protein n=1 Tax=Asticcacaulis sp. AND118 TaxID=2840468 RepID=UPI001CFF9451|nr:hemolysin family protein [Asticcacaulis sp. AND118]UDF03571.1 hemolysin family protein [Asticcacaulis sp. AND118]
MPEPDSRGAQRTTGPRKTLLNLFGLIGPDEAEKPLSLSDRPDVSNDLIEHARAFQNLRVTDVMTPRVDIIGIEDTATLSELVRVCVESEHSRLPVYSDNLDHPVGVIHVKDVFKLLAPSEDGRIPDWDAPVTGRLKRELIYVPSAMSATDLLLKMQTERSHMALVIDEHGGTDGLVTLEDLLEAVVGDIADEYDDEETDDLIETPTGEIEVGGRVELKTLQERLELNLHLEDSEEEVDTLGGLVAMLAGRVPQPGEIIPYAAAGIDIEVLDADQRRIKRLRLHRHEDKPDLIAEDL